MLGLGTLGGNYSVGYGINSLGQVVGTAALADNRDHAFLYSDGMMTDLNTLIAPASGLTLTYANAINNAGWIVGFGENSVGEERAYLLVPIPEPEPCLFASLGAAALLLSGRRTSKITPLVAVLESVND